MPILTNILNLILILLKTSRASDNRWIEKRDYVGWQSFGRRIRCRTTRYWTILEFKPYLSAVTFELKELFVNRILIYISM